MVFFRYPATGKYCQDANFFGYNYNDNRTTDQDGIVWNKFDGKRSSLEQLILAVQPVDYETNSIQFIL